ncbi:MAG: NAD(P)/FAD-dependent oxidoreductase [Clostridia bacterium]|nr:NAD(P)/FAD-dependent oxidoreductase [Clostridia bacterium]
MFDIAIIGGGVIGGMLARQLSRYQLSVCLLEKESDVAMGATKANSGIVHGGYDPEPGTLKAKLNAEGVQKLYDVADEIHAPYRKNGSFVCAFGTPEEEATVRALYERGLVNGIKGLEILTGDEARALEPALSDKVSLVLHVTNAGIVCPYELTLAAIGNAMDNGVALKVEFAVSAIERTQKGFAVIAESGARVEAAYVVNCAGAYADRIAAMVGDDFFTIIPRAGEYMLLDKNEGARVSHTIFQVPSAEGKGVLVSPTVDGNLLTGPTAVKVGAPDHTETTPAGLETVARLAAKSVPSVNFRQVITSFSGVRASEKRGDFIIEPARSVQGMLHVAAIDSPGLTSCVAIADYAIELLREMGLATVEKADFNPVRENPHAFREMSDEEKDAYIKAHPAYGKIVCRCETVSEGEIRDAIRRNPPARDIDGVKRRTRSGMGRCQGGFCMPYVMRLIAEENGVAMERVTKKGADSYQLIGKL